jgi:hypothetical protein
MSWFSFLYILRNRTKGRRHSFPMDSQREMNALREKEVNRKNSGELDEKDLQDLSNQENGEVFLKRPISR